MLGKLTDVHAEVSQQLESSAAKYKETANKDMIHRRKKRLPIGSYSKLNQMKIGPFQILKKINGNAYVVDLSADMGISSAFNVQDLFEFHFNSIELPQVNSRARDGLM